MAAPAVPSIEYPDGDTVDGRRRWPVWVRFRTSYSALQVQVYESDGTTLVYDTYLRSKPSGFVQCRVLWIPADIAGPGTYKVQARAASSDPAPAADISAYSTQKTVYFKSTDNQFRPIQTFDAWRLQQ